MVWGDEQKNKHETTHSPCNVWIIKVVFDNIDNIRDNTDREVESVAL